MGARLSQPAYAHFIPHLERARYVLGPTATEVAAEAGGQMPLEQAVRESLVWLSEPDGDADPDARPVHAVPHAPDDAPISPAVSGAGGLSPRELEVAALVARGLTNRRIAEELVITEGTAASHVKHILAKLVLDSRVQIVAWAMEHGLRRHAGS
jgi:DNA-binding NarL/FixJ family response regulator